MKGKKRNWEKRIIPDGVCLYAASGRMSNGRCGKIVKEAHRMKAALAIGTNSNRHHHL